LTEQGKLEEAASDAYIAQRYRPHPAFPHYNHALLCARCGLADQARRSFNAYLDQDPADQRGARMALAGMGFAPTPERASPEQIDSIHTRRAIHWDRGSDGEVSSSCGAELVANALARLAAEIGQLAVP